MRKTAPSTPKLGSRLPLALLTTIATGALCSGCFVIRREQFSKPVDRADSVKFDRIRADCESYCRVINSNDFTVQVSVVNWPSGLELQFLLNLIPIRRYDFGVTEPLTVEVELQPRTTELAFDAEKVFFVRADHVRLPPA